MISKPTPLPNIPFSQRSNRASTTAAALLHHGRDQGMEVIRRKTDAEFRHDSPIKTAFDQIFPGSPSRIGSQHLMVIPCRILAEKCIIDRINIGSKALKLSFGFTEAFSDTLAASYSARERCQSVLRIYISHSVQGQKILYNYTWQRTCFQAEEDFSLKK